MVERSLLEDIHDFLVQHEYLWRINGELKQPTIEDIKSVLDNAASLASNVNESVQIKVGRLLIERDGHHLDVYVRVGEIK